MTTETEPTTDNELDSDDGSTWDDGLTDQEVQSVLSFLRRIANENEIEEYIQDDDDENDDDDYDDQLSTTSMTTTAATYISGDSEHDDFAIETQEDDYGYDENGDRIVFYYASQ
jgi:hypothetical protein